MKFSELSIILPTLNEKENIIPLIMTINQMYKPLEILVVDDNSIDGTFALVKRFTRKNTNVKLIENNPPIGLTSSLQRGIDLSNGKFVLWMDADFSHPPELISSMMDRIQKADIVIGSWLCSGGQDQRKEVVPKLLSKIINSVCKVCFGSTIHTYTSGFVLARKSIFHNFHLKGTYGEYCIYLLVKQRVLGRKIIEVPFICVSRQHGKTKTGPNISALVKNGIDYIKIIALLLKPSCCNNSKDPQ